MPGEIHPIWSSTQKSDDLFAQPRARLKQIWAVGGGKGGVGKSLISSSLAISLSRQGNKVVAVDLDLGGANLHTTLGVDQPQKSLSDFFSGRITSIKDCIIETGIPNLHLISGAQDAVGVANIRYAQKESLLKSLRALDADYLIFDLGAGSNYHAIDFFLFADVGIVALLPEPTSIENAYRFIRHAYYRRLRYSKSLTQIHELIDVAMDSKNSLGIKSPADLFREVNARSPEAAARLKNEIEKFRPKILINQSRTDNDVNVGHSVKTVCKRYFGIEMDYLGHLDHDNAVWQAVRKKRPLLLEFPNSRLSYHFEKMTQIMIKRFGHYHNNDVS